MKILFSAILTLVICLVFGDCIYATEKFVYYSVETIKYDLDSDGEQEIIERIFVGKDPGTLPDSWVIRVSSKALKFIRQSLLLSNHGFQGHQLR